MSHQVYRFEPGQCTCVLGDPCAGSLRVGVQRMSANGILIEPGISLRPDQFVYMSVAIEGGRALALSGIVVSTLATGIFIRWSFTEPREADRIEVALRENFEMLGWPVPVVAPAPAPAAAPAPPAPAPAARAQAPATNVPAPAATAKPERAAAAPAADPSKPGAVDLRAAILKKAKKVRASDLASRLDVVQVLDLRTLRTLIAEAVDESVALLGSSLRDADRKSILEEAEESFGSRLELYQAEKAGLEEKVGALQEQLRKVQGVLEDERREAAMAHRFTVSDAGMMKLEERLGRLLEFTVRKGEVTGELERDMREVVVRLLDDERQKILEQAQEAQSDRIALLEKKVQRLADSLQGAEAERDEARRRAQALEASGLIPLKNIVSGGIGSGDPNRERKMTLLKEIVRENRDMRTAMAAEGRLPTGHRPRPPAAAAAGRAADEASISREMGIRKQDPGTGGEQEGSPAAGMQTKEAVSTG